jgi:alpha-L-fucosidase 2
LLPALPTAWPDGSIAGVRARGGVRVDLTWRQGRATALTLSAPAGSTVKIRLGTERFAVTIPASGRYMRHWA